MPVPRRLTHLPAGLGWNAEPAAKTPRASSFAELATHWTAPFEPIDSRAGDLASHWMKPFESPGMPAPIRPPTPPWAGPQAPSTPPRITAPGGMDTLREVTLPSGWRGSYRCGCVSAGEGSRITGRGGMDTLADVTPSWRQPAAGDRNCGCGCSDRREERIIGIAPFVCPAGFTIEWDEYSVQSADVDCINRSIRHADDHLTLRPVFDCCDRSTYDNPEQEENEWLDLFLRELARCDPSAGIVGFVFGDHGGSFVAREAVRDFLIKNFGYECGGCIMADCRTYFANVPPRVCLALQSRGGDVLSLNGMRERRILIPTCTLKESAPRPFGPRPTPPRPTGPVFP